MSWLQFPRPLTDVQRRPRRHLRRVAAQFCDSQGCRWERGLGGRPDRVWYSGLCREDGLGALEHYAYTMVQIFINEGEKMERRE